MGTETDIENHCETLEPVEALVLLLPSKVVGLPKLSAL
jgi:hypothetical protein